VGYAGVKQTLKPKDEKKNFGVLEKKEKK